jgi:hypothetical protein
MFLIRYPNLMVIGLYLVLLPSCSKKNDLVTQKPNIQFSTSASGLVVLPSTTPVQTMIIDPDPDIDANNQGLNLIAQAFTIFSCDPSFIPAIGGSISSDQACSLEHFFHNNPVFETAVNAWLASQGQSTWDNLLTGVKNAPWIYVPNYGSHDQSTPTLALSIEIDTSYLQGRDDFIPCYYSESDCSGYTDGLIGLEDDLLPNDEGFPVRELVIIFSNEEESGYNQVASRDIGNLGQFSGTLISGPTGPGCELGDAYRIINVYPVKKFNRSKKVKIATIWNRNKDCDLDWAVGPGSSKKMQIIEGKNILNKTNSTNYNISWGGNTIYDQAKYYHVWGVVFEYDWYALGKKISATYPQIAGCAARYVETKIKSKEDHEVYAYFMFYGTWCLNETRRFGVGSQEGDKNAFIDIKCQIY